jgi:hypothetical protein
MTAGSDDRELPWGDQLRRWRNEVKAWSQQELVDHIVQLAFQPNEDRGKKLDIRLVSKWENDVVRSPQGVYLRLPGQLGAPLPTTEPLSACSSTMDRPAEYPLASSRIVDERVATNPEDENEVLRRDFLGLSSGLGLAGQVEKIFTGSGLLRTRLRLNNSNRCGECWECRRLPSGQKPDRSHLGRAATALQRC